MAELREGSSVASVERIVLTGLDGAPVEAIHAWPTDASVRAGIVVHPDIFGVRPLFDDLCRRLATHGYAVACPEPFARFGDEVRGVEDPMQRMPVVGRFDDDLQLGDLVLAADLLTARDRVDTVDVIGFCMGGMQTLKAAATGRFTRAVPFYGMVRVPEMWRGPKLREPLATASEVCSTLAIFGGIDVWVPPEHLDELRASWTGRPDCEIVVYPEADHAFVHDPSRPVHRAADAADAWNRCLTFLAG